MIGYIKGSLEAKTGEYVILETGGIGYKVFMSSPSMDGKNGKGIYLYASSRRRCQPLWFLYQ